MAPCCSAKMQSRFKDWGDVRVFLAVMREGSTLAASRVLGINQTTVARRIDVLENALGLTLFEKTTAGSQRPTASAIASDRSMRSAAFAVNNGAGPFANTALEALLTVSGRFFIRITAIPSAFYEEFMAILIAVHGSCTKLCPLLWCGALKTWINSSGDTDITAPPSRLL